MHLASTDSVGDSTIGTQKNNHLQHSKFETKKQDVFHSNYNLIAIEVTPSQ